MDTHGVPAIPLHRQGNYNTPLYRVFIISLFARAVSGDTARNSLDRTTEWTCSCAMKKDTLIPCVVFSHRFHRFHRCYAMIARMQGFDIGAGLRADPHAKTTLPPYAIPTRSICEICGICEKIPRMESVCPFSSRSYMFNMLLCLKPQRAVSVVLSKNTAYAPCFWSGLEGLSAPTFPPYSLCKKS